MNCDLSVFLFFVLYNQAAYGFGGDNTVSGK